MKIIYWCKDRRSTYDREVVMRWGSENIKETADTDVSLHKFISVDGNKFPVYSSVLDSMDEQYAGVYEDGHTRTGTDVDNEHYFLMFRHKKWLESIDDYVYDYYAMGKYDYRHYCELNGMKLLPEHGEMWLCGHLVRCMTDSEEQGWNMDDGYCNVDQWRNYVIF